MALTKVVTNMITDLAVTTAKIAAGAVTPAKLATDAAPFALSDVTIDLSNGTDTDHDIDFTAGKCRDATDAVNMRYSSALTKQIDAAWAVGTDAGGMDTGAVANSTLYAVWAIHRSDTGVNDILFSTSFISPTMPTDYDYKRLIGAVKTDGTANIIAFAQSGNYFRYTGDVITEVADTTITADTFETIAVAVPPNCIGVFDLFAENTSDDEIYVYLRTTGAADAATPAEAVFSHSQTSVADGTIKTGGRVPELVDGSSQVDYACSEASGATTVTLSTVGFHMLTRANP